MRSSTAKRFRVDKARALSILEKAVKATSGIPWFTHAVNLRGARHILSDVREEVSPNIPGIQALAHDVSTTLSRLRRMLTPDALKTDSDKARGKFAPDRPPKLMEAVKYWSEAQKALSSILGLVKDRMTTSTEDDPDLRDEDADLS